MTAASVQDWTACQTLIERVAAEHPTLRKPWVDGRYRRHLVEHAATLGIDMRIVRRDLTTRGFAVLRRRWTVERTLGWLMNHRRLARDYGARPHRSEAMIHLAVINVMPRRLTAESTPTWRGHEPCSTQQSGMKQQDETRPSLHRSIDLLAEPQTDSSRM